MLMELVKNDKVNNICIVGVGNTIRADDGIGNYICLAIEQMKLPGISTMIVQQLDAELVEDLLLFNHVLITDAAIDGIEVDLYELFPDNVLPLSSSHHVNAAMLAALAKRVYGKKLSLFLCAVRGYDFEIGDLLSEKAKANCLKAISLTMEWIDSLRN
jgi:hydrogenase maturation protease